MSKRFRDIDIWQKEWYRKLTPEQKCAWTYLTDVCDSVGVICLDREAANFFIGAPVNWDSLLEATNGNIEVLPNGKWHLIDFVAFQYGKLSRECKPHISYLALLEKHGLGEKDTLSKGYPKGIHTLEEKEKDKEKEKVKDPVPFYNFSEKVWENIPDSLVSDWAEAYPACDIDRELAKMAAWLEANPEKRKKRYERFIVNWLSRAQDNGGTKGWKR